MDKHTLIKYCRKYLIQSNRSDETASLTTKLVDAENLIEIIAILDSFNLKYTITWNYTDPGTPTNTYQ